MTIERAFTEQLHPRGTGAVGGQFVAGGASKAPAGARPAPGVKKAAPRQKPAGKSGNLSFDGKRGPGYGVKGGDKRVRGLQQALNRLGLTDSSGKKLAVDGKLGPRTTAAIKKAQRKLGLKADGVVTPGLLRQLTTAKKLEKPRPVKKVAAKKVAAPKKVAPRPVRSGKGGAKGAPVTMDVGK
jgi:peptidoglycan hydrolase-like protein with peptidoglycan-binding domain